MQPNNFGYNPADYQPFNTPDYDPCSNNYNQQFDNSSTNVPAYSPGAQNYLEQTPQMIHSNYYVYPAGMAQSPMFFGQNGYYEAQPYDQNQPYYPDYNYPEQQYYQDYQAQQYYTAMQYQNNMAQQYAQHPQANPMPQVQRRKKVLVSINKPGEEVDAVQKTEPTLSEKTATTAQNTAKVVGLGLSNILGSNATTQGRMSTPPVNAWGSKNAATLGILNKNPLETKLLEPQTQTIDLTKPRAITDETALPTENFNYDKRVDDWFINSNAAVHNRGKYSTLPAVKTNQDRFHHTITKEIDKHVRKNGFVFRGPKNVDSLGLLLSYKRKWCGKTTKGKGVLVYGFAANKKSTLCYHRYFEEHGKKPLSPLLEQVIKTGIEKKEKAVPQPTTFDLETQFPTLGDNTVTSKDETESVKPLENNQVYDVYNDCTFQVHEFKDNE